MERAVLLNARRLNFDGQLDFGPIEDVVSLVRHEHTEPDQVVKRAAGCRVLITKELPLPAHVIGQLAEGTLICEAGTGIDNIHLDSTEAQGVTVCNVPDYSSQTVAQLTMRFLLDLSAGKHYRIRTVDEMDVTDFYSQPLRPTSGVERKTLGVIGAGCIGKRVIQLARTFRMEVVVHSRSAHAWPNDSGITQVSLDELLKRSDFVSLHVPLTNGTRDLIRPETIGRMKRGARLINTARGELVVQSALVDAINREHLLGAALDVQYPEPLPEGHVLLSMERVTLTPHIGWKAIESRRRLVDQVARNIEAFVDPQRASINTVCPG